MDRLRLIRFAEAEGYHQRRRNAPLRTAAELAGTIQAFLRCYAIASGETVTLQHPDLLAAERAFRRTRKLRRRPDATALPLFISVP
jgi:hypothetical protein